MIFPTNFLGMNYASWQSTGLLGWWPTIGLRGLYRLIDYTNSGLDMIRTSPLVVSNHSEMGQGIDYAGAGYYTVSGVARPVYGTDYSFAAWTVLDDTAAARCIASHRASGNTIYFQMDFSGSAARFIVRDNAGVISLASYGGLTTAVLYHIVGVRTGNKNDIYVNGILGTPDTDAKGAISGTYDFCIGKVASVAAGFEYYDGRIYDCRLYNYALGASEVSSLYSTADRWGLYRMARKYWMFPATPAVVPDDPTDLIAVVISSSEIDLTWTDNASDEDGFKIEHSLDGVNFTQIDTVAADEESYNDTACSPGTLYYYRVRAYNGAGDSGYTNIVSGKTPPDEVTLYRYLALDGGQIKRSDGRYIALVDGVPEPDIVAEFAWIYIDEADGDLKIKYSDGTIKTIAVDT